MGLQLITPPTAWPVSLDEAKAQVRVTSTDEDTYFTGLIKAATRYVEQTLSTSIAEQTWKLTLDQFSDAIELLRGPVKTVDAVEYIDAAGTKQTVDTAVYTADLVGRSQWIVLNSGESWPTTLDAVNVVSITYTAGMTTVPDDLKQALLLLIGYWFANREAVNMGNITAELPLAVDALLQSYRWVLV